MKNLSKNVLIIFISVLTLSCSNKNNIIQIMEGHVRDSQTWQKGDNIPAFILNNEYMDKHYSELYEDGGLVNAALINRIINKALLLEIITSCDQRLDRKPNMRILENINFGENNLFDYYYNFSIRQIATLRFRVLYGSATLANEIDLIRPDCENLNPDTMQLINSIRYSGNEHGAKGFVIELRRLKMNKNVTVDEKKVEQLALQILRNRRTKEVTFKELDAVAYELAKTTIDLNPDDTFQINYTGPYVPYTKEKKGFDIRHGLNNVFFSLQLDKLY